MNSGKGSAWKVSPVVSSVITPVPKSIDTVSPAAMASAASVLSRMAADVDGVAVENAREACGNYAGHAVVFQHARRMLARRAAAEVFVGNNDVARLYVLHELGVDVFHRVRCEFLGVGNVEVAGRNNNVGVDVVAILENSALSSHFHMCSFRRSDERRRRPTLRASRAPNLRPTGRARVLKYASLNHSAESSAPGSLSLTFGSTCFVNVVRAKLNGLQAA